jgi:large repetitive protein
MGKTTLALLCLIFISCGNEFTIDIQPTESLGQEIANNVRRCAELPQSKLPPGEHCQINSGSGSILLAGDVLLEDRVIYNGQVLVNPVGLIQCVGCDCKRRAPQATQIICPHAVISPGFINAHDHIGWMGEKPYVAADPNIRYEHRHDWRKGEAADHEPKIPTPGNATVVEKIWGEMRFMLSGTTSTNASGVSFGLIRNLDRASGLEGLPTSASTYETFPLGDSGGVKRNGDCRYPSVVSTSTVAGATNYTAHIGEGISAAAHNEILCLNGAQTGGVNILGANVAIVHGIGVTANDVATIAHSGAKLIWSPRSNISLYGDTTPVTLYAAMQVPIALGTDWLPSGSMNMLRELECASSFNETSLNNYFSARDLWRMATSHAALALGVDALIGKIKVGYFADLAIFGPHALTYDDPTALQPYRQAINAELEDVVLTLRGGRALSGDANIMASLANNCDMLNVNGSSKRVCLQSETGKTLAQVTASLAPDIYGVAYSGTPPNEPSCVPRRDPSERQAGSNSYSGSPTTQDSDGDGINNGHDSRRHVFNPIRPMDGGMQP